MFQGQDQSRLQACFFQDKCYYTFIYTDYCLCGLFPPYVLQFNEFKYQFVFMIYL
jgi:hypothetical protein